MRKFALFVLLTVAVWLLWGCAADSEQISFSVETGYSTGTSGVFDPGVPITVRCDAEDISFVLTARSGSFTDADAEAYGRTQTWTLAPGETAYWTQYAPTGQEQTGNLLSFVDILVQKDGENLGYACVKVSPDETFSRWLGVVVVTEQFARSGQEPRYFDAKELSAPDYDPSLTWMMYGGSVYLRVEYPEGVEGDDYFEPHGDTVTAAVYAHDGSISLQPGDNQNAAAGTVLENYESAYWNPWDSVQVCQWTGTETCVDVIVYRNGIPDHYFCVRIFLSEDYPFAEDGSCNYDAQIIYECEFAA